MCQSWPEAMNLQVSEWASTPAQQGSLSPARRCAASAVSLHASKGELVTLAPSSRITTQPSSPETNWTSSVPGR